MKIEELRIIVDEREKKSGIPKLLSAIGVKTEIKTLPIGDYIVAPETVVERKTIADLLSSIFDGRLFDQCSRLTEHYQHPILLVEGNVDEIEELTDNPLIFSATPGRLHKTESCCFSILFDFLIFLRKGPFVNSFRVERDTKSLAVCVALGVGIIGILNSNATVDNAP